MSYSSRQRSPERETSHRSWFGAVTAVVLVLFLLFVWGFSPVLHGTVMWLWGNSPMIVTLTIGIILGLRAYLTSSNLVRGLVGFGAFVLLLMAFGLLFFGDKLANAALAQSINPVTITEPLEMTSVRFVPKQIAETLGRNMMSSSAYELGDFDPYEDLERQEIIWTAPHVPNSLLNQFTLKNDGLNVVSASETITLDHTFKCGEGAALWGRADWQFIANHFFAERDDFYYQMNGAELLTIAPYTMYKLELYFGIPVQVPYWAGVQVMHEDCGIENLTPEEAMADVRFAGRRIVPEAFARRLAESWGYKGGVINAVFRHIEQTELPDLPGGNQMPILVGTTEGPQWFHAMEPYGPDSRGTSALFYVDAHTATVRLLNYPNDSGLLGPLAALNTIGIKFPAYNWAEESGVNAAVAIEPRPVVHNAQLFWLYTITTKQYSGITESVLVSAHNSNIVYSCAGINQLKTFALGQESCRRVLDAEAGQAPTAMPTQGQLPSVGVPSDLSALSEADLLALGQQVLEELQRRQNAGQ